ncbi:16S rRNA (guanine(527)-N(7))-methyltransferase RsmG [Thioalkalicoccus limnaeus]|uniref:Ribosomal RNA small subunit methyltransferase G n=1 Tax=Thioalkalicoccus limnaeus TaxID=120681 RepID=A0ABV4BAV1_9GAMM
MGLDPGALRDRLDAGLACLGFDPELAQRERLIDYLMLLARWNQAFNLTAVRDPHEMVARHLLDSLSIAPYLSGDEVLDLGTGAGLPGLPLAILDPRRYFVLLDSNGKKIRFVRQAVLTLGLDNCEPVQMRADVYRPAKKFATIVSRAMTSLAELRAIALALTARPARLLVMKGREPHEELADPSLTSNDVVVHPLQVPFVEGDRHLIEIRFH